MRFLDTNIFLRLLAQPHNPTDQQRQQACLALFQRVRSGLEEVTTCEAVIAEILFVLCSPRQYHLSHNEAGARLRPLLTLSHLTLPSKRVYLRALDIFAAQPTLDFEDALVIAHMERHKLTELYSYDRDFEGVPGITRVEP